MNNFNIDNKPSKLEIGTALGHYKRLLHGGKGAEPATKREIEAMTGALWAAARVRFEENK